MFKHCVTSMKHTSCHEMTNDCVSLLVPLIGAPSKPAVSPFNSQFFRQILILHAFTTSMLIRVIETLY